MINVCDTSTKAKDCSMLHRGMVQLRIARWDRDHTNPTLPSLARQVPGNQCKGGWTPHLIEVPKDVCVGCFFLLGMALGVGCFLSLCCCFYCFLTKTQHGERNVEMFRV